jgi:hypothetical protein
VPTAALEAGQHGGRAVAVERKELPGEDELVPGVGGGRLQRAVEVGLAHHEVGADREHCRG